MPTTKKRLSITLPEKVETTLLAIADRDEVSLSTKALELLELALEFEEDVSFDRIAQARKDKDEKLLRHEDIWK